MSERKVLQKYFPPDFDPSVLERRTKTKDKTGARQLQTIRLMAPFSMKCTACGEYIYKGRKFNARKETTEEKYYAISIYRFYIRCTRCSAEITFKTDPKNMDYTCERGARRNFEVWREAKLNEETEEERLDRLEKEEQERDVMKELEKKTDDARTEMAIADALDNVRMRNAMRERVGGVENALASGAEVGQGEKDLERERLEREDGEAARVAFLSATGERVRRLEEDIEVHDVGDGGNGGEDNVRRVDTRERKGPSLLAGIKKKVPVQPPVPAAALVAYGDDDDDDD
ncbi:Pre-mRNA-splicing factor cwf16 [Recurvomyces mirabilis]|uniref:Splicing factor YJU2 n=1 Tax=Recurvomyces mirabilis TaxID=574656 RepID=A0AAE1C6G3_9PEZI|nr:Pre-mRNA-splicing factor cwf16 [Recurvomyces mirabilis]KAK5161958.1 Pre-mRNA-splicing factor cwf16 [Recurvomyces mirabilis]